MPYLVLARKWRPQTFAEVVGQRPVVRTLERALGSGRIAHAYLFSGPRGVGKTTVARILAKAINCQQGPTARPCNACPSCQEIVKSSSLDVLEIDGASNRGIDEVRDLRESVRYTTARDRSKVIIIDEVHMLTKEAWNALLKTLEEPPPHVVFIFATTEYRKIPATILSRCQQYDFNRLSESEIYGHLRTIAQAEQIQIEDRALALVAAHADGALRDAEGILDRLLAFGEDAIDEVQVRELLGIADRALLESIFEAVAQRDARRALGAVQRAADQGLELLPLIGDLVRLCRDLLVARSCADPGPLLGVEVEQAERLRQQAEPFSEEDLVRLFQLLSAAEKQMRSAAVPRFVLDVAVVQMLELKRVGSLEQLLATLSAAAAGGAAPAPAASRGGGSSAVAQEAPRPAPAAAPSAAAGGASEASEFKALVRSRKPMIGRMLDMSEILVRDETLQIKVKRSIDKKQLEDTGNLGTLMEVASQLFGRPLQVRIDFQLPSGGNIEPLEAAAEAPEPAQDLVDAAGREPVVRTVLDAFGGRILDVRRPRDGAAETEPDSSRSPSGGRDR
ncbi:MAG TPA: DNA polymerase III subunit gamma/tau [Acidobacteriota bacterium]